MSKGKMSKSPVTPELGASESKAGEAASKYVPEGGDGEEAMNKWALALVSSPALTPRTPGHKGDLPNFTPPKKIQSRGVSKVYPAGVDPDTRGCCVIS